MAYQTPRALQRAISDRARAEAHAHGGLPGDLVDQFYLSRLLARVFRHDPDGWLLKGGQALLARWPGARHSRDIDLLAAREGERLDEATSKLILAAQLDAGDFIRFEHLSTSTERAEREIRKVKFSTYCGTKRVKVVSVDVVTGLDPLGVPIEQTLKTPFALDLDTGVVTARMWPIEDHVADKIAAMYERHKGQPSSRVKDLIDLVLIACAATLDGCTTHTALRREAARRTSRGVDLLLPGTFTIPDRRSWASGYPREAKQTRGLDQRYRTFKGAEPLADAFITPLLADAPPRQWVPAHKSWS